MGLGLTSIHEGTASMWVRLTHAEKGSPIDIQISECKHVFKGPDSHSTEILGEAGVIYVVSETPDQIWKATGITPIQVGPPTKLVKTSAKPRRK